MRYFRENLAYFILLAWLNIINAVEYYERELDKERVSHMKMTFSNIYQENTKEEG